MDSDIETYVVEEEANEDQAAPSRVTAAFERLLGSVSFMRGNLLVLTLTRMSGMFARSMAFPYASLYVLALGGNPEQIGLINSLSPLASLLVFPIGGYLADHRGRVRLLGGTSIVMGCVYGMYIIAPSWQWLLLLALLLGFGVVSMPADSAITADSLAPADRGRGISISNAMSGAPAIVAPLVAAALLEWLGITTGMRCLYAFLGLAYIVSGVINLRLLYETTQPSGPPLRARDLPRILRDTYSGVLPMLRELPASTRGLGAMVVLGFIGNVVAAPFWVVYAQQELGLSTAGWGTILLIESAVRTIGYIPAGLLVDRVGRVRSLRLSLVAALIAVPGFIFARGFALILAVRLTLSLATALYIPAGGALMADTVPRALRGRTMAALGRGAVFLGSTGGGLGGPGLGYLVTLPAMASAFAGGYLYAARPWLPWAVATLALTGCLVVSFAVLREHAQAEG